MPLLERREAALTAIRQGLEAGTAAARDLPRVLLLESEYHLLVTATAQLHWIRSVIEDLRKRDALLVRGGTAITSPTNP